MHDDPGTDEPHASPATDPPRRSALSRIAKGVALVVYWIAFVILIGVAIAVGIQFGIDDPDTLDQRVPMEVFGVGFVVVCVLPAYVIAAYLVRRRLRATLLSTVALITVLGVSWLGWVGYGRYEFRRAVESWPELRAQLDPDEPPRSTADDPELTAAHLYAVAYRTAPEVDLPYFENGKFYDWIDSEDVEVSDAEAERRLVEFEDTIELIHRAAAQDGLAWTDAGVNQPASLVRTLAEMVRLDGHVAARRGDDEAASLAVLTVLRMSNHVRVSSDVVSELVAINLDHQAISILRGRSAGVHELDAAILRELRRRDYFAGLSSAMAHEAVWALSHTESAEQMRDEWRVYVASGLAHRDRAWLVRQLHELSEYLAASPTPTSPPTLGSPPWWAPLSKRLLSDYARPFAIAQMAALDVAYATAAIRLEQHRAEHGVYPDDPAAMEDWPTDPYFGAPIEFVRIGKGFTLNVGSDEFDIYADQSWESSPAAPGEPSTPHERADP